MEKDDLRETPLENDAAELLIAQRYKKNFFKKANILFDHS